jgi:hypothetical protein
MGWQVVGTSVPNPDSEPKYQHRRQLRALDPALDARRPDRNAWRPSVKHRFTFVYDHPVISKISAYVAFLAPLLRSVRRA